MDELSPINETRRRSRVHNSRATKRHVSADIDLKSSRSVLDTSKKRIHIRPREYQMRNSSKRRDNIENETQDGYPGPSILVPEQNVSAGNQDHQVSSSVSRKKNPRNLVTRRKSRRLNSEIQQSSISERRSFSKLKRVSQPPSRQGLVPGLIHSQGLETALSSMECEVISKLP